MYGLWAQCSLVHFSSTFTQKARYNSPLASTWHNFVASELKDHIWHSLEWQIGSFSSEATICNLYSCDTIIIMIYNKPETIHFTHWYDRIHELQRPETIIHGLHRPATIHRPHWPDTNHELHWPAHFVMYTDMTQILIHNSSKHISWCRPTLIRHNSYHLREHATIIIIDTH